MGRKRIGLATSQEWGERLHHRLEAGMSWHNAFVARNPVTPYVHPRPGLNFVEHESFHAWLRKEKPDAVIVETVDYSPIRSVVSALPRKQRPLVVTMDWPNPYAQAGVDQRVEQVGAAAINLISGVMIRGELGPAQVPSTTMIDGVWVNGLA
jgi:hypothetical protein